MIPVLSLWQPWASAIVHGFKRVETRSWRPPSSLVGPPGEQGPWFAIHAAKTTKGMADLTGLFPPESNEHRMRADMYDADVEWSTLPYGAILGVAQINVVLPTDVVRVFPDGGIAGGGYGIGVDCAAIEEREARWGDYSPGRYAWFLKDVYRLHESVPFAGGQGFSKRWALDEETFVTKVEW